MKCETRKSTLAHHWLCTQLLPSNPIYMYHPLLSDMHVALLFLELTFQLQLQVCHYNIVIISESGDIGHFPSVDTLPSNGTWPYIFTLSLQPHHHFNVTITAYNSYGTVFTSIAISKSHYITHVVFIPLQPFPLSLSPTFSIQVHMM